MRLILNGSPKPLDENTVQSPPFEVHTYKYLIICQWIDKIMTGELTALNCVEDGWLTLLRECFFLRIDTKSSSSVLLNRQLRM